MSPGSRASGAVLALLAACSSSSDAACGAVERNAEPRPSTHVVRAEVARFEHHPPTSGPHRAVRPTPGVAREPLPEADQVGALEQGMVILHYDADAVAPLDVDELARVAAGRRDVIVTPAAEGIDGDRPVAFTAWERRQRCSEVSEDAAHDFVEQFAGRVSQEEIDGGR